MKRTLRKITAFMSAAAMMAQLSFTGVVFAEDSSQNATKFVFSDDEITVTVGDYSGYKISGTALTINASSMYEVSGSCTDGSIKVKKGTEGVNIILDGLTLASSDSRHLCQAAIPVAIPAVTPAAQVRRHPTMPQTPIPKAQP